MLLYCNKNGILVQQMTRTVVIVLESCLHFHIKIQLLDLREEKREKIVVISRGPPRMLRLGLFAPNPPPLLQPLLV